MNRVAKTVDWAAIEGECRNSALAVSAIARKHQISYDSVRKRADRGGWRRKVVVRLVGPSPREANDPEGAPDSIQGASDCVGSPTSDSTDAAAANAPTARRIGDMRDPADPRDPVGHVAERVELAALEAAIDQHLAKATTSAERTDRED